MSTLQPQQPSSPLKPATAVRRYLRTVLYSYTLLLSRQGELVVLGVVPPLAYGMSTTRPFRCEDLLKFNNINLDELTETVGCKDTTMIVDDMR